MRVALYYPWIYLKGGAERALYELVTRSRHTWTVYTNHFEPDATFPELEDLDVVTLSEISVRRNVRSVVRAALTVALQPLDLSGYDRAVTLSEGLGNLLALRLKIPTTCVCLTPLKVAYDDVTNQRFFGVHRRGHYRAALAIYRAVDVHTWKHFDKVFCISETVRDRLLAHHLIEEDRIEVLYPGVDHERFRPNGASEHLFLLPGRIMWQKNIELAIESWRFFKPHPSDNDYKLVIAGMVDAKSRSYLQALRQSVEWREDVEFICTPDDETLDELYHRALGVLFTAPSEDFGLVPLEAMACGKPVIAQRRGGPTETIIDGETGILAPGEPRGFAAAMTRLVGMNQPQLSAMQDEARARAVGFDWKNFVGRIDDHLEDPAIDRSWTAGKKVGSDVA
ncbi:MAG TPA: glycosyltransferase family 4 protein [Acidimicrobiales bacterium]